MVIRVFAYLCAGFWHGLKELEPQLWAVRFEILEGVEWLLESRCVYRDTFKAGVVWIYTFNTSRYIP